MYKDLSEYGRDCVVALKGCLQDPNYLDFPFEGVLNTGSIVNRVLCKVIEYIKTLSDPKYFTEEGCKEYYLNTTGQKVFVEEEDKAFTSLFAATKKDFEIKDPAQLFINLAKAYKKVSLKEKIKDFSMQDELGENPILWSDDFYNDLVLKLDDIDEESINEQDGLVMASDIGDYYEELLDKRETQEPVSFHWKCLDDLIPEGPTEGHGGTIAGSTGMGKSALALNVMDHLIEADVPTVVFPIEMGMENTVDRYVAHRIKVPYNELVKLKKSEHPEIKEMIDKEMRRLKFHDRFAICQDPVIDLKKLEMYIKQFQKKVGQKYCVVIIDLLTMISEFYKGDNLASCIEKAINALDILSKKLGFHYIGVVQLNRSIEQDKVLSVQSIDKLKPTRSSIKNSSAILERSRYCLTIFRPAYFAKLYLTPEEAATVEDVAEVTLMKANNEDAGRIYLNYDGPTFTLTERETMY